MERLLTAEDGPLVDDGPSRPRHNHRFIGPTSSWAGYTSDATAALLQDALTLRIDGDPIVVTKFGGGHAVPKGVSFLREIRVDVEAGAVVIATPLVIGAQGYTDGEAIGIVTDGDEVRSTALAAGESARATLPDDAEPWSSGRGRSTRTRSRRSGSRSISRRRDRGA